MKTVITIISLFLVIACMSQSQIVFEESKPESFLVKYESSEGNSPGNHMIKSIAKGLNKSVYLTKFTFSYKQNSQVITKPGQVEFIVTLNDINFSGDVNYKNFPLTNYLFPAKASYTMNWLTTSNTLVKSYEFTDIELSGDPAFLLSYIESDSTGSTDYKMEIVNKSFSYTESNAKKFDNYLFLIDDYYNSDIKIQKAFTDLQSINLDDVDRIHEYKAIVDNNEVLIQYIQDKNYEDGLYLQGNDPLNFMNKYNDLIQINNQAKGDVYYVVNNLHQIYYNKALEFLANNKMAKAEEFFNKSVNANLMFAPAHYQLAKIYYHQGKYEPATERVRDILNKMNPDPDTRAMAVELGYSIYNYWIDHGIELSQDKKHDEALQRIQEAKSICQSTTGMICNDKLENALKTVLNAKYFDMCDEASQLIKDGKFEDAQKSINNANFFQRSNKTYVTNTEVLGELELDLYNALIFKGKQLMSANKHEEALVLFEQAGGICSVSAKVECSDELNQNIYNTKYNIYLGKIAKARSAINDPNEAEKLYYQAKQYQEVNRLEESDIAKKLIVDIKQIQYDNYVQEGYNLAKDEYYENALQSFEKATAIDINYDIKPSSKLKNYIFNAAKEHSFRIINAGLMKVQINDLNSARIYYKDVKSMIDRYSLNEDLELQTAMADFKGKIFSQECRNKQGEFDKIVEDAMKHMNKNDFIKTQSFLDKAIEFAASNSECEISTTEVENKRSEILPGSTYQKLLIKTSDQVNMGKYGNAIETYIEAENYFSENRVSILGLKHIQFHDYFKSTNSTMVNYCANYYLNLKKYDLAIDMIRVLESRNYHKKYTKNSQRNIGQQLAIEDFKKDPSANPKHKVVNYTNGSKYFKYLYKAYVKQWKKLK